MSDISEQIVKLKIRVRYGECDAQQVVFNARYADYADLAATEYMRALMGSFQNLLDSGYDNQVVNLNIDWFASAIFDDVLLLSCKLVHVGNSSFRLETNMFVENQVESTKRHVARAQTTYVLVSADTFEKATIPDDMRSLFAKKLNVTVDQSGVI